MKQIVVQASLATQRAVEEAGQQVEFEAIQRATPRKRSGQEIGQMRWVPSKRQPFYGEMQAGAFYTRFSEYGTVHQTARPVLVPAAETTLPYFIGDMERVYR